MSGRLIGGVVDERRPDAMPASGDEGDVLHLGGITAAREMGVQYRTLCGVWKWPTKHSNYVQRAKDLALASCPLCVEVALERSRARSRA